MNSLIDIVLAHFCGDVIGQMWHVCSGSVLVVAVWSGLFLVAAAAAFVLLLLMHLGRGR